MEPEDKERIANECSSDGWLRAALKQYGEADPRPGLENRVLAAVRAEREHRTTRQWHWWPALATLAAILVIGTAMHLVQWRNGSIPPPLAKRDPAPSEQKGLQPSQAKMAPAEEEANRTIHAVIARNHVDRVVESATPRLERFPSPEPLSEQEKILARYVQQFPREADLLAQAQTELTGEEMTGDQAPPEIEILPNLDLQNQ